MDSAEENMTEEERQVILARGLRPSERPLSVRAGVQVATQIAEDTVEPVVRATRLQWAAIGVVIVAVGGPLGWAFVDLIQLHTAQAQTAVKADAGVEQAAASMRAVEKLDARLIVVERSAISSEAMLKMLVIERGLPLPPEARPRPPDGGQ